MLRRPQHSNYIGGHLFQHLNDHDAVAPQTARQIAHDVHDGNVNKLQKTLTMQTTRDFKK